MKHCFSILFITLLFVCITPAHAQTKNKKGVEGAEKKQIPDGFNPSVGVLLIEDSTVLDSSEVKDADKKRAYEYSNHFLIRNRKKMAEYLTENYSYKYEFSAQSDIYGGTEKYFDKTVYRYALVFSLIQPEQEFKTQFYNGKDEMTHRQPVFVYYLYDRLNNKSYAYLEGGASLIMPAFKKAMKRINGGN